MDHAGAPTIRCVEVDGYLCAIEGSHRLAQALQRGLIPKIVVVEPDIAPYGAGVDWSRLPRYEFPHVLALREKDFG